MSQFISELKATLHQDISNLDTLSELLNEEKAQLRVRNSKAIDAISKRKTELVKQIEVSAKHKAKLFSASGLGIRPGQVTGAIHALGDEELSSLWRTSREKLESCKEMNHINGTVISRSLQRTQKLMSIIRGQGKSPNLYGQSGKEQRFGSGQQLGKA